MAFLPNTHPCGEEESINFLYLKIYILEQFIQFFILKKNENNGKRLPSTVGISLLMERIMWHYDTCLQLIGTGLKDPELQSSL
jgi:hypothetical protein